MNTSIKIGVVIPCYKETKHVLGVIDKIGSNIFKIYVIDDACPDHTGEYVEKYCKDSRVEVIYLSKNLGVGGAVISGYQMAMKSELDIVVKIDGDGQMDPRFIDYLIEPILSKTCDYTKGNRFFFIEDFKDMPKLRIFGNVVLSFINKLSTGYWNIFDSTNGFTAINKVALSKLPLNKIAQGYFFESDILFRLNCIHAVVLDIPLKAIYGDEASSLVISKIMHTFIASHTKNFFKRIFYRYFLRDFSFSSINLVFGIIFLFFGSTYGFLNFWKSYETNIPATSGTVMMAALPIICGFFMLLNFLSKDMNNMPNVPLSKRIDKNIKKTYNIYSSNK
ncbi:glycosyltransferase family 2 protein [Amylibacter sp.]|nr:glycosyltransferase family 2 protein [Amylibacter sp.]